MPKKASFNYRSDSIKVDLLMEIRVKENECFIKYASVVNVNMYSVTYNLTTGISNSFV